MRTPAITATRASMIIEISRFLRIIMLSTSLPAAMVLTELAILLGVTALATPPRARYVDQQFPDQVVKLQADQVPEAPPDAGAIPENAPTRIATARKTGAASLPASQDAQSTSQPPTLQISTDPFTVVNKILGESGQHIEALGSDAMQRWMRENGVEEGNGEYW